GTDTGAAGKCAGINYLSGAELMVILLDNQYAVGTTECNKFMTLCTAMQPGTGFFKYLLLMKMVSMRVIERYFIGQGCRRIGFALAGNNIFAARLRRTVHTRSIVQPLSRTVTGNIRCGKHTYTCRRCGFDVTVEKNN